MESSNAIGDKEGTTDLESFVSVVIITGREADLLRRTVESVIEGSGSTDDFEIVLVDHVREEPPAFIDDWPEFQFRHSHKTFTGLSDARNHGFEQMSPETDIVALIDDDATAEDGWIDSIRGHFHEHPDIDIVGGIITNVGNPSLASDYQDLFDNHTQDKYGLPIGANMAFRAEVLADSRYDPRFELAYDDFDFVYGAQLNGHQVGFEPLMRVRHENPDSLRDVFMKRYRSSRQAILFFHKYRMNPFHVDDLAAVSLFVSLLAFNVLVSPLIAIGALAVLGRSFVRHGNVDAVSGSRLPILYVIFVTTRVCRLCGKLVGVRKWQATASRRS